MDSIFRSIAGALASSPLLSRGRKLFELNRVQWTLGLTKWEKLLAGGYLIMSDYSQGIFPPTFKDQARAYEAEIKYNESLPGVDLADHQESHARKPFWGSDAFHRYAEDFARLLQVFERIGLARGSRLLELGCGVGWTAEFLALSGYSVLGTTLAPNDIRIAEARAAAFRSRGLPEQLRFQPSPMESVDQNVGGELFDGVFVFEALHHAFDWRATLGASHKCLNPGGWFILAKEPNVLHTFVSYRAAKLSNTHEIGMSQRELVSELRRRGFREVVVVRPRINNLLSAHWIAARK
jgi:2-polyprenyl-3-methyl-5-hydroxy-6-metoxy-1,4-benzoquinol methylase